MGENVFFSHMTARILLVRHGVSAHKHDGSWIDEAGAQRFIKLYDAAGIRDDAAPPEVMELASRAGVVAASTMRRAVESIERLAPGREAQLTPLLCELDFHTVRWLPIRLPIDAWDVIDHAVNTYTIGRRRPTPYLLRARDASEWLTAKLAGHSSLLAVTHGGFRRFLWASLVDRGWKPEFARKTYHNWSVWSFREP
jgi:broad specificity phosphatase PhoE